MLESIKKAINVSNVFTASVFQVENIDFLIYLKKTYEYLHIKQFYQKIWKNFQGDAKKNSNLIVLLTIKIVYDKL